MKLNIIIHYVNKNKDNLPNNSCDEMKISLNNISRSAWY